jgi:hypothetical protein
MHDDGYVMAARSALVRQLCTIHFRRCHFGSPWKSVPALTEPELGRSGKVGVTGCWVLL